MRRQQPPTTANHRNGDPRLEHTRFGDKRGQIFDIPQVRLVGGPYDGSKMHAQAGQVAMELPDPVTRLGCAFRYVRDMKDGESVFLYVPPAPETVSTVEHPDGTKHLYVFSRGHWEYKQPVPTSPEATPAT